MVQKKLTEIIPPKKEAKQEKELAKAEKEAKPGKEVIKAEELAKKQREISVAEFFTKNRHLLGFDNPRKALLTTVKEAVDNSLDATEDMGVLPDIIVKVEPLEGKEASVADRFLISIEDNGPGIVKSQVPKIFAKLLYGSKFHTLRQQRGQQGLGVSAAGMYGQLTTGKPVKITTRIAPNKPAMYYELHIDTKKNEPEVLKEEEVGWEKEHGTKVAIELEAKYVKGRQSVEEYLKQTAIANPHANIVYYSPEKQKIIFPKATDKAPIESRAIKPHPYGVELGMLMNMLKDTKARNLQAFLKQEFSRVSPKIAKEICQKAGLYENSRPSRIATHEVDKLYKAINETKIMAPPTNCLAPIGEELMLKGLKKEINAEFYAAATRPPAVYRGNPFQIECCTGDSKLCLEDGLIISIKDYVENEMLHKKVFSMDDNLKILPSKVLSVHKFKNQHKILKITTRTGRSLNLTENNEIPIIRDGHIVWRRVGQVLPGEFVAVPRVIKVYGRTPSVLDIMDATQIKVVDTELVTSIMDELKKKYGCYKKAAEKLEVDYGTFKAYKRRKHVTRPTLSFFKKMAEDLNLDFEGDLKNRISSMMVIDTNFTNPCPVKVPAIDEDFLYVLGLLNSDGYISRRSIVFVNKDEHLHKTYGEKINYLFGLKAKRYKEAETCLCNKTLFLILKQVEKIIPELPDNLIVAWLKGYVDGDGWVSLRGVKIKDIGIATAEKEEAELVQSLLLRLGIIAKIQKSNIPKTFGKINGREVRTKKIKYNIIIGGMEHIKKFYSLISFRQLKRANTLSEGIKNAVQPSLKSDVVPVGNSLCRFRIENNLFQYELGFSDQTIRQAEKNSQCLTRINLQKIVSLKPLLGSAVEKLRLLAFSDILWDRIVDIKIVPDEEYVYDLTVETGNFVANNIVMHNCSIAYGGELPAEELVRLVRFANRVPLLYQQSACATYKSILETNWRNYSVSQSKGALPTAPMVIMVHMASVWVPFTSESKEAIAHYPEIIKELKLALQECGRQLALFLSRRRRAEHEANKKSYIETYIPHIGVALKDILSLKEDDTKKVEKHLKEILEKHRGSEHDENIN